MSGPGAHAIFGGSGAGRLLACPGGYRLTERALSAGSVRNHTSSYAAEGSVAHELLELALNGGITLDAIRAWAQAGHTVTHDGHLVTVTEDMADGAAMFLETVEPYRGRAWTWTAEQRVSLERLWPGIAPAELAGTADFQAWSVPDNKIVVADYKYGKGVPVEVRDNAQLLFYAVGVVLGLPRTLPMSARVELIVVQPRVHHPEGHVRRTSLLLLDLMMWAQDVLVPGVEAAVRDDAPLVTGSHCRWCPVLALCPAVKSEAQAVARRTFGVVPPDPVALTPAELGQVLDQAPAIEAWFAAVRGQAEARLLDGEDIPGWKMVPRKSPRRWSDDAAAARVLQSRGLLAREILEIKLRSPAQLEKRLGSADWAAALPYVDSASTGSALARATDPRPALRSRAALDFPTVQEDDTP